MSDSRPLADRLVVVTRPTAQAAGLARAIEAAGGHALLCPLLTIEGPADAAPLKAVAGRLADYRFAIFVSQNAVAQAMPELLAAGPWPRGLQAITLGPSSAAALKVCGLDDVIVPGGPFDSETLLMHPVLQAVGDARVVIFRGDGGRELLGRTLAARGATVDHVQCYRRLPPTGLDALQLALDAGRVAALTVTSSEALRHLLSRFGPLAVPLFVPHERIHRAAVDAGWQGVVLTPPGDAGLLAAMEQYFSQQSV